MAVPAFKHLHRVSYADCTLGNHVYYARYLDILEETRGEFFRAAGVSLLDCQQQDTLFPVIECHLRYRAPARYDEVIAVEARLLAAGRLRLNFAYAILGPTNSLLLEAEITHVCTGLNEMPKRLPESILRALSPHIQPAPAAPAATMNG